MKSKLKLTIVAFIISISIAAQETDWEIHIGTSNKNEYSEAVVEYYDKGYYIEGIIGQGGGWQVKTDINGNIQWNKYLSHPDFLLQGWSVTLDDEGNRYVAGPKFNNVRWPFVTKFNTCGDKVWCKIIADEQLKEGGAMDIILNQNNELLILSNYISLNLEAKIFVECFDASGEYLWKKEYAKVEDHPWMNEPVAYDLMEHNHEYFISGYCYWPFPSDTTHYFLRPLFIGIDSLFNEKWILPFAALDSVFGDAYSSIPINDSIILGVGIRRFYNNEDFSLLALYNTNGQEIGFSQITNSQIGSDIHSNLIKKDIVRINDSLYLAASMFGPDYSINPGGEFVLDTAGNLYNYVSNPNTSSASLIKSSDNNFVLASTITKSTEIKTFS